jgi:hypothetical protein
VGTVRSIHEILAWFVILVGGAAGLWATAAHWVESLRSPALWVAHNVFHTLVAVQVALGAIMVGFSDVEPGQNHMFYGFLTFASVGIIIAYRHLSEFKYLLYGLGGLFVMGLAIRALLLEPLAP